MPRERAFKSGPILTALRRRMIAGELRPGDRLPTRADLERSFGASRATIQQVFDRLAEDGFVTADGRNGTTVADHPPHLHRIALVAPWSTPEDSRFWMALQRAAQARGIGPELRIVVHAGVEPRADNAAHRALRAEAEAGRLAGVIFAAPPGALVDASFPRRRELPRVAIMRGPAVGGTPTVYPDEAAFSARAAEFLARRGRRRVAHIGVHLDQARRLGEQLAARGIATAPWRLQTVPLDQPEAARACAQLLFQGAEGERPDALVIGDDNLVGPATAGVADAGAQRGVDIVGHCNFPWPTASALPIRRLGYDAEAVLERCLEAIAAQRDGRRLRDVVVAPVFDDELPATASAPAATQE